MIKNDWLEIKRLCKTARIKAKKNGENPWCHIDLEDDTFVISSRSVKVNEDLQYMVSVSCVYHDTRIHNELFDKKSGEYTNKPTLTIEIENLIVMKKNIKKILLKMNHKKIQMKKKQMKK